MLHQPDISRVSDTAKRTNLTRLRTPHNFASSSAARASFTKQRDIPRFRAALPEYFIRMLTDPEEVVLDPFGGSCITGEVAERLGRKWVCAVMVENYLQGARGRFERPSSPPTPAKQSKKDDGYYRVPHPGLLWNGGDERESAPTPIDGGKSLTKSFGLWSERGIVIGQPDRPTRCPRTSSCGALPATPNATVEQSSC